MRRHSKHNRNEGYELRDFILGGQDGLVNVLGIVLAVATAVIDVKIVIVAGLAATFAESISMAAVAYTSTKAAKNFYESELQRERREIEETPEQERKEIRHIYYSKGFRGPLLQQIVKKITSKKKLWLDTMMKEELGFSDNMEDPKRSAFLVGISALIGSFIPLLPFFLMPVQSAIISSILLSVVILFITGAVKAKITVGNWVRSGIEIAVIGMLAAFIGYLIGALLGAIYI